MTKLVKYSIFLTICTCWDLYTTWLRSPDLSREQNYIVKYFNLNFIGFIIFQISLLIFIIIIIKRTIVTDYSLFPSSRVSFSQLCSCIYFGDSRSLRKIILSSTSLDRSWYFLAGILIYAIPLIHIVAGINNLILHISPNYVIWFNTSLKLKIIIGTFIVIIISLFLFLIREYNAYKKKMG